jgi:hypothetical protein
MYLKIKALTEVIMIFSLEFFIQTFHVFSIAKWVFSTMAFAFLEKNGKKWIKHQQKPSMHMTNFNSNMKKMH